MAIAAIMITLPTTTTTAIMIVLLELLVSVEVPFETVPPLLPAPLVLPPVVFPPVEVLLFPVVFPEEELFLVFELVPLLVPVFDVVPLDVELLVGKIPERLYVVDTMY